MEVRRRSTRSLNVAPTRDNMSLHRRPLLREARPAARRPSGRRRGRATDDPPKPHAAQGIRTPTEPNGPPPWSDCRRVTEAVQPADPRMSRALKSVAAQTLAKPQPWRYPRPARPTRAHAFSIGHEIFFIVMVNFARSDYFLSDPGRIAPLPERKRPRRSGRRGCNTQLFGSRAASR